MFVAGKHVAVGHNQNYAKILVFVYEFKQMVDIGIVFDNKDNDIVAAQIKAGRCFKLRTRWQDYQPGKQMYIAQ